MMSNFKLHPLDCPIVQDLLPLYHDDAVSETTRQAVSAHLNQCPDCQAEYDALCAELPVQSSLSPTREKFSALARHLHKKQICTVLFSVLAACLLLGLGFLFFTWAPVKPLPSEEFVVQRVYPYHAENGSERLFVLYECPWSFHSHLFHTKTKDGTIHLTAKGPLWDFAAHPLSQFQSADLDATPRSWEIDSLALEGCDEVTLQGQTIWQRDTHVPTDIPDYVYAFDQYRWDKANSGIQNFLLLHLSGRVAAQYQDGHEIYWDLDGNAYAYAN